VEATIVVVVIVIIVTAISDGFHLFTDSHP